VLGRRTANLKDSLEVPRPIRVIMLRVLHPALRRHFASANFGENRDIRKAYGSPIPSSSPGHVLLGVGHSCAGIGEGLGLAGDSPVLG